jgi:caffeoyl-CoA O-methyltransferase
LHKQPTNGCPLSVDKAEVRYRWKSSPDSLLEIHTDEFFRDSSKRGKRKIAKVVLNSTASQGHMVWYWGNPFPLGMMKMVKEEVGIKKRSHIMLFLMCFFLPSSVLIHSILSQEGQEMEKLDEKVTHFLENNRDKWRDWNVPEVDGKVLYDLIIKSNYRKALEIGTSTGHSAIWIAWALSKIGGKLITIEIDEDRYRAALANFEEAGLSGYIDARLGDAHELVKELEGPFDFVFSDADKEWYKNYFIALAPKLEAGSCFTAHNVSHRHWSGIGDFLDYLEGLPNFETRINRSSREGISISCKKGPYPLGTPD